MKEADIDARLMKGLRQFPCVAIKLTTLGFRGSSGWPDRLVIVRRNGSDPWYIFIELKTDKGRLTPMQSRRIAQLELLRCEVHVLHGAQEVDAWLLSLAHRLDS